MSIKWTPQNKLLSELKPYHKNPRIITGKKLDDLKKSLKKFGLSDVITINTDGTIIGGHARYYSLVDAGETIAMCLVPDRELNEKEVEELNIRLNKNIAGDWDHEILANQFEIDELKEWGFEDFEFGGFEAGTADDQGALDKLEKDTEPLTCPECGHIGTKSEFKGKHENE